MLPWCGVRVNDKGEVVEKPNQNDDYYRDANGVAFNFFEDLEAYNKATICIKLPTLSEFVKKIGKKVVADNSHCFMLTNQYADFLFQQNKLGMYVASKDGEVLEEPRIEDYIFEHHPELVGNPKEYDYDSFELDSSDYRIHQSEVMFFGCRIRHASSFHDVAISGDGYEIEIPHSPSKRTALEQTINNTQLFYVVGK